jgi:hypothetical protein
VLWDVRLFVALKGALLVAYFMLILAWLPAQPLRCRQHITAANMLTSDGLHGVISLRREIWLLRERRLQEITTFVFSIILKCDIHKFKLRSCLADGMSAVYVIY